MRLRRLTRLWARKLNFQQILNYAKRVVSKEISVRPDRYDLGPTTAFDGRATLLDCHAIFLTGQLRRIFAVRRVISLKSWVYHLVDTQFVRLSV